MKKTIIATSVLVLLSVLLSACNLQAASPTQMGPDQINTIAAATVQALTTQMAPPPATATPPATEVPTATPTLAVPTLNLTVIPTLSLATSTLIPLPTTAGSTECNRVYFLSDENVPDGTVFKPGAKFVKSWKIKNDGTCTWTTLYSAVAFSNDPTDPVITGQGSTLMKASVVPGGVVTISVEMVAPDKEGTYTQVWKMQDADGKPFGIGGPAGAGWYVQIKVSKTGAVTPGSVSSSIAFATPQLTGTITTTAATSVSYSWQVSTSSSSGFELLTGTKETKTINGTYTVVPGDAAAACTQLTLASGSTGYFRLNLNAYGYSVAQSFTCP